MLFGAAIAIFLTIGLAFKFDPTLARSGIRHAIADSAVVFFSVSYAVICGMVHAHVAPLVKRCHLTWDAFVSHENSAAQKTMESHIKGILLALRFSPSLLFALGVYLILYPDKAEQLGLAIATTIGSVMAILFIQFVAFWAKGDLPKAKAQIEKLIFTGRFVALAAVISESTAPKLQTWVQKVIERFPAVPGNTV